MGIRASHVISVFIFILMFSFDRSSGTLASGTPENNSPQTLRAQGLIAAVPTMETPPAISVSRVPPSAPPRATTTAEDPAVAIADQASCYTVRVLNVRADVFEPEIEKGHGTGFIVELTPEKGVVFTNRHVVAKGLFDAQLIRLGFSSDDGSLAELIEGTVVYESNVTDFAVIEFDPRKLTRTKNRLTTATLANPSASPYGLVKQAETVMAYGFPLFDRNKATSGSVSGMQDMPDVPSPDQRTYIQIDAPINPGNSGGPVIRVRTGEVLGMTTAGVLEANDVGFAIPITELKEEYDRWKANPNHSRSRGLTTNFGMYPQQKLELEGLRELVESRVPDYFTHHEGVLVVSNTPEDTNLRVGDIILTVNGHVIGNRLVEFIKYIDGTSTASLEIIRNRKIQKIDVPLKDFSFAEARQAIDFVLLSGLVIQDLSPHERWSLLRGESGVIVRKILPGAPVQNLNPMNPGSVITQVQVNGDVYPIENLAQFKRILKKLGDHQFVRFIVRPPVVIQIGENVIPRINPAVGAPEVELMTKIYLVPVDQKQILTRKELSLRLMRDYFDFSGKNPQTWDWRFWVGKSCRDILRKTGGK